MEKVSRELLAVLEPHYDMPGRRTIASLLHKKYAELKERLITCIRTQETVSFTIAYWTPTAMESYLGVTSHFIDEEWIKRN